MQLAQEKKIALSPKLYWASAALPQWSCSESDPSILAEGGKIILWPQGIEHAMSHHVPQADAN